MLLYMSFQHIYGGAVNLFKQMLKWPNQNSMIDETIWMQEQLKIQHLSVIGYVRK